MHKSLHKAIARLSLLPLLLLLLAGLPPLNGAARPAPSYVITADGAVGDGQTLNTKAIQATVDRCAADGGGVVVVPKGTFVTGSIFLKKKVSLRVDRDGVLKGSVTQGDYPLVNTRWEGVERPWTAALVNAVDLTGVSITGDGAIDGSGEEWMAQSRAAGRPRLICFQNCRQARISGLTLRNQAIWCLHILYSEDVVAENLTIRAQHNIPSSDGIDVDSCKNVRLTHCDIDVNDDCVSLKSGRDADGLRVHRPCENIVVEHCRFGYGHGGVAMGSETSGGIRHVEVRDCIADAGNWAPIRFKTQPSRGGVVEDIVYRNMTLRDTRQAFEFNLEWRMVPPFAPPAKVLPVVRNVKLINISGTVTSAGIIHGLAGSPIIGVVFQNCKITAQRGLTLDHVRRVNLSGLALTVTEGLPITETDVKPEGEGPTRRSAPTGDRQTSHP